MINYSSAEQLLRPGELGLFIFTEGDNLEIRADGSGYTGDWVVDPSRRVDWIVIYKRGVASNELWMAKSGDYDGPRGNRYSIGLRGAHRIGVTDANWHEFASTTNNPVRYLRRD